MVYLFAVIQSVNIVQNQTDGCSVVKPVFQEIKKKGLLESSPFLLNQSLISLFNKSDVNSIGIDAYDVDQI